MDAMTPYPPLTRAPLRMRGIFGIAWQLYKRGFWQMFFVSLLLVSLPTLLALLPKFTDYSSILKDIQNGFSQFGKLSNFAGETGLSGVREILGSPLIAWPVFLVNTFLVVPMYQGAIFLEMEERMEGRADTFAQLFRYALPLSLKRFYTTFLSLLLLALGVGIALMMISSFLGIFGMTLSFFSSIPYLKSGALHISFFIVVGIILLVLLFVFFCVAAFSMLIYPVAAHEKKFAFAAIGRAFRLTAKRFWRILGASLLCSLVIGIISCVLCLPALLSWQNIEAMFTLYAVLTAVATGLTAPYSAAFRTVLYVDTVARVDGPELSVIDPDSVPDPDPDELRDGPRTL